MPAWTGALPGLSLQRVRGMSSSLQNRLLLLAGYLVFAGALGSTALSLGSAIVRESVFRLPVLASAERSEPSRVERYHLDTIAAEKAPQVPVPRVIRATESPQMPAAVLAVRLDSAESIAAEPIRLKLKMKVRRAAGQKFAKAQPRRTVKPGKLPPAVIADALLPSLPPAAKKKTSRPERAVARVETARDITHRNFNIALQTIK